MITQIHIKYKCLNIFVFKNSVDVRYNAIMPKKKLNKNCVTQKLEIGYS